MRVGYARRALLFTRICAISCGDSLRARRGNVGNERLFEGVRMRCEHRIAHGPATSLKGKGKASGEVARRVQPRLHPFASHQIVRFALRNHEAQRELAGENPSRCARRAACTGGRCRHAREQRSGAAESRRMRPSPVEMSQ